MHKVSVLIKAREDDNTKKALIHSLNPYLVYL